MPTRGKISFLCGVFLICMCGLMLQIIETRVLSVISWYYLAFFAIGMAMFGMTAGSLFIYFRERLFPRHRLFENFVVSLALTRSPWPVSLVYGADLGGAATGCLVA